MTCLTLTTGSDEIAVLSINVTMRALFPSTDGTLLPVTDTESNFNVFPNESVFFKSADLAARQELDKTVRTTATRQPHVRFVYLRVIHPQRYEITSTIRNFGAYEKT